MAAKGSRHECLLEIAPTVMASRRGRAIKLRSKVSAVHFGAKLTAIVVIPGSHDGCHILQAQYIVYRHAKLAPAVGQCQPCPPSDHVGR